MRQSQSVLLAYMRKLYIDATTKNAIHVIWLRNKTGPYGSAVIAWQLLDSMLHIIT